MFSFDFLAGQVFEAGKLSGIAISDIMPVWFNLRPDFYLFVHGA
jgi:hypothetical protein